MNRIQRALDAMRHPGETPEQTRYRRRKMVLDRAAAEGLQIRSTDYSGVRDHADGVANEQQRAKLRAIAAGPYRQPFPDEFKAVLAQALGIPVEAIQDVVAVPHYPQGQPAFGISLNGDSTGTLPVENALNPQNATVEAADLPELDGRPLATDEAAMLRAYRRLYETSGLADPRDFIFASVPLSSEAGALMTDEARFEISRAATTAAHNYLAEYLSSRLPGARA